MGRFERHPATCIITPSTGKATCDGDGNGQIGTPGVAGAATHFEWFRTWHHLANAGMVQGDYTGMTGTGGNTHAIPGQNVPMGPLQGTGYMLRQIDTTDTRYFTGPEYGNDLEFGARNSNGVSTDPALRPKRAWSIDNKIDDGLPGQGKVLSYTFLAATREDCATTNVDTTAQYDIDKDNTDSCTMVFVTGF